MEFRILGPLEVVEDGRPVPLERRLSRALLAYLLLHANEPVSSERLVDQLWGETPPKTAVASLQNYVSRLRKSIGAERLRLDPGGYVLRVDPERFDLARFERLVSEAQGAPPQERADLLRAALALRRGEPLEDLALEEFAQSEISQLEERLLSALESRVDADLELGRGAELVEEIEGLIAAHPLRERLRGQLMLALYRAGRQAEALDAFRDARSMLRDELGLEPGEELRALERRILEQDPTLVPGTAPPTLLESRRTVTVLFCDVVDSTRLATELDPEAYRRLLADYHDAARRAIEAHGGWVEKFVGDAVMALFGVPDLHEDDALRAVLAAFDVRSAVARLESERELHVRIAVNTGEVVVSSSGRDLHAAGAAINVAAHMEKRAQPGEIVLGGATERLVRDAVRVDEVELGDGLVGWRLDEVIAPAPPVAQAPQTPLVGRKKELRRLRASFQRAKKDRSCSVVTVVGEPGIGKTRLARELVDSVRDGARVLVGRCASYGAGATYLPIAEIVRRLVAEESVRGIAALLDGEEDAEQIALRVAEVVGLAEGPAAPGESFWAIRRLLEAVARRGPVVVALDDVHWAEPTLLDLVEYLGEWAEGPIYILCLARPELLESRAGWGGPASTGFLVELDPLEADEVGTLLDVVADGPVAPDIRDRIVEHAGGNPLFAEQLLALASEAPDVPLDQAPPTVEALIAARLDRLTPSELRLLRHASIIGRLFRFEELHDLAVFGDADLASLERRGLVHALQLEPGYRFHHVLVRDVAYRGIPKAERAELHEQAADNLDRRDGPDELVGYHLEQAYRCRAELARVDDRARRLAHAAGERLGAAGIRAWKRADVPAAITLIGRAVDLLPENHETRLELLCELGIACRMDGDVGKAEALLVEARDVAQVAQTRRVELKASVELSLMRALQQPDAAESSLELARAAIPELEVFHDDRALGRAWYHIAFLEGGFKYQFARQEKAAARAASHYARAGWSPSLCLGASGVALCFGPRNVRDGIVHCAALLAEHAGDRASEANVLLYMGQLEAMQGSIDEGRFRIERALEIWRELGQTHAAEVSEGEALGSLETLANRFDQAEEILRRSCDACSRLGESAVLASRAGDLANVLYLQGHFDESSTWTDVASSNSAELDLDAQVRWRRVAAKLEAQEGRFEAGLELAKGTVNALASTDALNARAYALSDLAEVLRLAGREEESSEAIRAAITLFELKGNAVEADRARTRLERTALA
jgi:DNA-binding SARP family transcriptional activator